MRTFDLQQQFNAIKASAVDAAKSIFPVEGKTRGIKLDGITIDDHLSDTDYASQAKAKAQGNTWGVPVYASLSLYDKATGKVLDHNPKVRLFLLPKITRRFSYIVGGNEYQVHNQLRLKPGVYTVRKQNQELKTIVNLAQGKSFELAFDRSKGTFKVTKVAGGQAKLPLFPLLTHLGMSEQAIQSAWGSEIAAANKSSDPKIADRVAQAFGVRTGDIKDYFGKTKMDPAMAKLTLGESYDKVSGPMLLTAAKKLLDVHFGKGEPNDLNSLEFKEVHSLEDFIKERLEKNKDALSFKIKRTIDNPRRTHISQLVNPGAFNSTVESFFTHDDKAATPEQTNPLEMVAGQYAATIMGAGGIKSIHAVTDDMREVHATHYGFIDPVHSPESDRIGVNLNLPLGVIKDGKTLKMIVADKAGKPAALAASQAYNSKIAYPGQTGDTLKVKHRGETLTIPRKDVDYFTPNAQALFSWSTNLIPFLPSNQGNRAMMASKQMEQAVSLKNREAPLVQVGGTTTKTLEQAIGETSAVTAPEDGVIKKLTRDEIVLKTKAGLKHIGLYDNFILNRKAYLNHEPVVKAGDHVKKGQLLADSNFTRGGALSLGTNLKSVSGDTKIFWIDANNNTHYEPIRNLVPTENIKTPTIDGNSAALRELKAFVGHYTNEGMVEVTTWSGYKIKCTESHSLVCLRNGKLVKIKPNELDLNKDFLPKAAKITTPVLTNIAAVGQHNIPLTREFGELCGLYIAEGWPTHSSVAMAASDPVVRNRIVELTKYCLPDVNTSSKQLTNVIIFSAALKRFFIDAFGKGADNKKLPGFAYTSPIEFREGILSGYWAGDGCVRITSSGSLDITAFSNSEQLRDGLCFLGTTLGLRLSYLSGHSHTGYNRRLKAVYGCRLTNLDAGRFPKISHSYKQAILDSGLEKAVKWQAVDMVPLSLADKQKIRATAHKDNPQKRKKLLQEIERGYISRKKLLEWIPAHKWATSALCWERVQSVEKVKYESWVYDLDMGETPYFMVSNGIFVHNTAYVPYEGFNFEDGIIITESAADKLTSSHIHRKTIDINSNTLTGLSVFRTQYPSALTPVNLAKLGDDGVIKKGQHVEMGDAVIAALKTRAPSQDIKMIQRQLSDRPRDASAYWTYEDTGEVVDVQRTSKTISVFIKTEEKAKIGDKLAGRHGNKGIITKIILDSESPHNAKGEPVEVLLNPHGIISRINIGQVFESAAGKVAKKTGKTHVVKNFTGENYLQSTQKLLSQNGVDDKEELFDPKTGKSMGQVHAGNPYILKLSKLSQGNFSVRQGGPGHPYDTNLQPLRAGGEDSAKALDVLTMYSMLAHGARANLREMASIKSSQNDEFWTALKSGQSLPTPKSPFIYDKFLTYLKGAGINIDKKGTQMTLTPLTDAEVKKQSSGEVINPVFYTAKDMQPKKDGFLDPVKFGGFKGANWGHIVLKEPVINPVFENAVKKITGLGHKFESIMAGALHLDKGGVLNTEGRGVTGGHAMEAILKKIDVEDDLKTSMAKALVSKGAVLDALNKRIRYLQALKRYDLKPHEAYLRKLLPVVPPMYRPIYPLPDGNTVTSDLNLLYQNIGVLNHLSKYPVMDLLSEEDKAPLRADIYTHVQGLSGLTDLNIKGKPREGFISEIRGGAGGQPKEGMFISKVLKHRLDYSGRGTIIPEPSLGVDEVAIPEQMAWKLFEPFVIRELRKFNKTPNQAMDEIEKKTELAKRALEIVMKDRKVLLNRAPSLHKFSIMAFRPQITSGTAIKIPPLVTAGYSADFDGDQQHGHIVAFLDFEVQRRFDSEYLEARKMTARFKETVPVLKNGDVFLFHLEDFPHGELLKTSSSEKRRIDLHTGLNGIKVLAYDDKTQRVEWRAVSHWSKHYQREVVLVNLQSGRQIYTDDDPRAIYGIRRGTLEFIRGTPQFAVSNQILVPRVTKIDCSGDIKEIRSVTSAEGTRAHILHDRIVLDSLFGYLVGVAASDGWCSQERQLCIAGITAEILDKTDRAIKTIHKGNAPHRSSIEGSSSYGCSTKHTYPGINLTALILPMIGKGADNKHLPPFFLSACREFREGLFAGLMDTDGSISVSYAKKMPQLMANFSSNSLRLTQEVQLLAASIEIKGRITASKTPAGKTCWMLAFSNIDIKKWGGLHMVHPQKLEKLASTEVQEHSAVARRYDVVPISFALAAHLRAAMGAPRNASRPHKTLYTTLSKAVHSGTLSRQSARDVPEFISASTVLAHPDGASWMAIIENTKITWDPVESIELTGIREDGYDLTVPGYETFMNVEGVILSNTMSIHAPITDEANEEAEKMLPSRNLYKPGTGRLMMLPSQEAQVGIFYLSKTPEGRTRLASILGKAYPIAPVLNAKATQDLLHKMSKELPSDTFGQVLTRLKSEGEKHAFEKGFTLGMNDLAQFAKERDALVAAVAKRLPNVKSQQGLYELNQTATTHMDKVISNRLKDRNNPLFDMVESGARGGKSQLRSILATPLLVTDAKSHIIPHVIKTSYAEGLDMGDYWTSMSGARRGMMDRSIQTSVPGGFSKDILASTIDNVITANDCGTKKGILIGIDSPDVLDRFTSEDQLGVSHNTLVDSALVARLKKAGAKVIMVRSPLTCLQPKGTCGKCYGLDEHSQTPEIGENIGAKAGQTISEPLIQMIMRTFHTGGTAGAVAEVGGYTRINQLLKMPKTLVGAAGLAPLDGTVTNITPGAAGGFDVIVLDKMVHINQGHTLKVKMGSQVKAGDPLSDGVIRPDELVKLKGMGHAQAYLVDELHKAYADQGIRLHRKTFETVVRSLGNTTQVRNNPLHSNFVPGDVIPYTVAQHYNDHLIGAVPLEEAVGYKLAAKHGPFDVGHELAQKDIQLLRALGHKEVSIAHEELKHTPMLTSVMRLPLLKKNWMSALGYHHLAKALTEGAGQAWTTDLEDYHPIPAFAHGTTFGQGKDGKY